MKYIVLISLISCFFIGFSQNNKLKYNRPFVIYEGCDNALDKEKCFIKKSSEFVLKSITDSLRDKLIKLSKQDTITLSLQLYFDEKGAILSNESHINSSVDSTSKDLRYIIDKFPNTKPVLDEFNKGVATFTKTFYGFKIDSTRTTLKLIPDFEPTEVPFKFLGEYPVFDGCLKDSENEVLFKCMNKKLTRYIQRNFRSDMILSMTGLPEGINSIFLFFKIDKTDKIKASHVRAPHPALRSEGYRLIEHMPSAKSPGKIKGKAVDVSYFLPIKFVVQDDKKSKKGKRKS